MAVIAKQRYKLDIVPKGGWVIVYASQHDDAAREIEFEIINQGNAYLIPESINISVQGIKSNKGYFSHSCSYSGNVVTMALADDMTDVIGKAICVLKFTNSSQQKLATAKFILNVDSDSSSEGVIVDTEAEEIFNQMLNEIRAQATSISADIAELQSMVGSPLVASTVSAMTDHNKIYVYTGSESGYTNGNWYYWDGSAWTSGGVYNAVAINMDSTPTQGSNNTVSSGGVFEAFENIEVYSEDVIAEYDVVTEPPKTYAEITQAITPAYTNQGKWNAETDSADSGINVVYSRFNGIAQYKKIYVDGKGASSDYTYPLCAFYDSNGDKISAILANEAWGTVNMLISVPPSASYLIVNGSTEQNRPISPSVRGLIDGEKIGTLIVLTGVLAEGAKKTDGTIAAGANYYHVRYDTVPDSDYIYVSGVSWGASYPLILFYDSSDSLIRGDLGYGSTKFNDIEISIPNGTAYYIVNMTHSGNVGSAQGVNYATSQTGRVPTKTQAEFNAELETFIRKKYLFVGDSYAQGYSHDGTNPGWCNYVAEYMGLDTSDYKIVATGGYGFSNGGYSNLVEGVVDTGFTDVVVCGGYNDNTSTIQNIINAINTFKGKVVGKWPGAKIHVGFIAYNKAGNGEGAISSWEEKRANLVNIVLPAYQKSITVGCEYLNNVEYALGESGLSPSDGYHPNAEGNQAIAQAISNALLTGSAPLPYNADLRAE